MGAASNKKKTGRAIKKHLQNNRNEEQWRYLNVVCNLPIRRRLWFAWHIVTGKEFPRET